MIAREAVDAHLSVAGDLIDPSADGAAKARALARAGGFYASWLPGLVVGEGQRPGAFGEFGPLAGHLRFTERAARRLARSTFYGMSRWQGGMEERQAFLARLVDIGAELFAMSAAVVRAEAERREHAGDPDRARAGQELADAFCRRSRLRTEELFRALRANTDGTDAKVAERLLADRYTWLEEGALDPSAPGPPIADATPGPSEKENLHHRMG